MLILAGLRAITMFGKLSGRLESVCAPAYTGAPGASDPEKLTQLLDAYIHKGALWGCQSGKRMVNVLPLPLPSLEAETVP
jgi:hypothetical protein